MGAILHCSVRASPWGSCSCWGAHDLGTWASVVGVPRLSWPMVCAIVLDQGSNSCFLHWQTDSYPLYHQGSPRNSLLNTIYLLKKLRLLQILIEFVLMLDLACIVEVSWVRFAILSDLVNCQLELQASFHSASVELGGGVFVFCARPMVGVLLFHPSRRHLTSG